MPISEREREWAGCSPPHPWTPFAFHSWPAPSGRPTSQGGSAACPPRFAQRAAPPPWTPLFVHSWPAPSGRPTSQGGSAPFPPPLPHRAAPPPPAPPPPDPVG